MDAVGDVLNCMRRNLVPESILWQLLQFCKMFLQREFRQRFVVKLPIALVQRNAMVVNFAGYPELMIDMLRTFLAVQFELVRFHYSQLLVFCVST